jgi:hypothetical protein
VDDGPAQLPSSQIGFEASLAPFPTIQIEPVGDEADLTSNRRSLPLFDIDLNSTEVPSFNLSLAFDDYWKPRSTMGSATAVISCHGWRR